MCPLLRARTGAAAFPLAIPAVLLAAAGLVVRTVQRTAPTESIAAEPRPRATSELTDVETLVYELLDAHADTIRLLGDLEDDDAVWSAHADYLRALQREGRALLSQFVLEEAA